MEHGVSVITPVYNAERWVAGAVLSVAAQQQRPLEHIVVDDGSTDRTSEVVEALGLPGVRVVRRQHRGASAARNTGLSEARGDRIAFLDADDRWCPEFLATLAPAIDGGGSGIGGVFCHSTLISEAGGVVGHLQPDAGHYGVAELLVGANPTGNGSCLVLRRSALDEIGGFDEELPSAQDLDLLLRLATRSSTPDLVAVPQALVEYRLSGARSISGNVAERLSSDERLKVLGDLLAFYGDLLDETTRARAYELPAIFAYLGGRDELGDQWWTRARGNGLVALARTNAGRRLLFWKACGSVGRPLVRQLRKEAMLAVMRIADIREMRRAHAVG